MGSLFIFFSFFFFFFLVGNSLETTGFWLLELCRLICSEGSVVCKSHLMLGNRTTDCYQAPLAAALSAQIEKVAFIYSNMQGDRCV